MPIRVSRSTIAIALGVAASIAIGVWMLEPRFAVGVPAPIDDWAYASEAAPSIGDALTPFVDPPEGRFRPAFDFFQDLIWHTLGAPDMTGPNLWNLLRLVLFVAAVGLVPAFLARAAWPELRPVTIFAIAALPPALILTTLGVPVNLARFGTAEPMLVGFAICGGALMLHAVQRFFAGERPGLAWAALAVGWPLYVLGIFAKEPGVAYGVLLVCAALALAQSWRREVGPGSWRRALRDRRIVLVAALFLLPLLWEAYLVAGSAGEQADFYDKGTPEGLGEWADRLRDAFRLQWDAFTTSVGTPLWRALAVSLPFLIAAVWLDRRRVPWLAIGCVVTGWLMLIIQGIPGAVASRYYIPTIALFAIAATLCLAGSRAWLRWAAIVAAGIVVITGGRAAHSTVQTWATDQEDTAAFVGHLAQLEEAGCSVHMARINYELAQSLPVLVGLETDAIGEGACPEGDGLLVAELAHQPAPSGNVGQVCRSEWESVYGVATVQPGEQALGGWNLWRCDDPAGSENATRVIDRNLLVPGVPDRERVDCIRDGGGDECDAVRLDAA